MLRQPRARASSRRRRPGSRGPGPDAQLGSGGRPRYTARMLTLKADPSVKRQIQNEGPMAVWRDAPGGGREGLVLLFQACSNPSCPCRDVFLEGWLVDNRLRRVAANDDRFVFEIASGGQAERRLFFARVDLENGEVADDRSTGSPPSEPWALEWLRSELDGPFLAVLEGRLEAGKRNGQPPYDWRKDDWSWWEPGMDVSWMDVFPEEDAPSEVILDNQTWAVSDLYCVEPGCDCEEVRVNFWRERGTGREVHDVGTVSVIPEKIESAQFLSHGADRALLKELWAKWCTRFHVSALLRDRREEMRKIGPEIHRLRAARRQPLAKRESVGPNDRCPCGSGKKYKRCCMGKAERAH
jgi:hypothetical protein